MIIFITGANKGLGLGLVSKILSDHPSSTVLATIRSSADPAALRESQEKYGERLGLIEMDLTDEESVQAAYEQVSELEFVKKDGIGMLVLNGGVNPGLEDTVSEMKLTDLETNWQVNVVGNVRVVQAFLPLVQRSKEKSIVAISSGAGSTDWKFSIKRPGDGSSYSISKCALNHFLVRLADEFKATGGLDVSIYSPGIVDTAQTHMEDFPYEGIKMTPAKAADLWYERFFVDDKRPSGSFFDHEGKPIPW